MKRKTKKAFGSQLETMQQMQNGRIQKSSGGRKRCQRLVHNWVHQRHED